MPLPPHWTTHVSRSTGHTYWFNSMTGESRYEAPFAEVESPPAKRARPDESALSAPEGSSTAAAAAVAAAYDARSDVGLAARSVSSILHLKNFNNWVKAVLISEYAPHGCPRVLDLACGKLGDLHKWRLAGVSHYCGVDISGGNVHDGALRFNSLGGSGMRAKLVRADLGAVHLPTAGVLAPGEAFDAVSVQFALHYFFDDELRALRFFRNVADALALGGVFLGTLPDTAQLVRRLRDRDLLGGAPPAFGNALYRVAFTQRAAARQYALGDAPYGVAYDFFLVESVEDSSGGGAGVREYVVPWALLERLAAAAGLEPLARDNFHDFFARHATAHAATLRAMRVLDCEGALSAEEWEVAGLYRVFAFRKVREASAVLPPAAALFPSAPADLPPPPASRAVYHTRVGEADIVDLM